MSQAPIPTRLDLSDAPGDLDSLDSIFGSETTLAVAQPPADASAAAPATPATPPPDEPFVKGAKSVYKSREAAVEGINQKDALIEQLRQQYALTTGVDPITKQPIVASTPQAVDNYVTNPKKYVDDLNAAKSGEDIARIQQKLVLDTIQPMAPAIAGVTRANAESVARAENPEFGAFYGSADYKATLDAVPSIKEAIEFAEGRIDLHHRLPDLYKTAYLVSRGIQLPELLKRASAPTQNQPAGRPTAAPTTPTPQGSNDGPATTRTHDGRKTIIEQFEGKYGKAPLRW